MNEYLKRAYELKDEIIENRRLIHAHPELGMNVENTNALIWGKLQKLGYTPKAVGGGIVATICGPRKGKVFLLRAETDALPMQEETGLPFASVNPGAVHACGHDTHSAMLLGAAVLLREHQEEICGTVKLMFQPGEETGQGAVSMLNDGLLENPPVDVCMAIHSLIATDDASGMLACYPGPATASCDVFRIDVTGKGTHGSRPESGIDPINILCRIHGLLQTIGTREKPQKEPVVLTVCQIQAGKSHNIIPSSGYMTGTIRTFNPEMQRFVRRRLTEIAEGTARMLGGEGKVTFERSMLPATNDEALSIAMRGYMEDLVGAQGVFTLQPRMASDDFAAVMAKIPGTKMRLSMGSRQEGYTYDLHNPKAVFNEETLPIGAAAYAYGAVRWLNEHSAE